MSDTISIEIDGAEAHVVEAALAIYRQELTKAKELGGPAFEAACVMDPIAQRFQMKLHDYLYGRDEPMEPDWNLPEQGDPITAAKSDYWAGDHHVYPADEPNIEGMPEFNGAFGG